MSNDVKHLFMCLLASCIPSLEKCLLGFWPIFCIGLSIFLLLRCMSSMYSLDIHSQLKMKDWTLVGKDFINFVMGGESYYNRKNSLPMNLKESQVERNLLSQGGVSKDRRSQLWRLG